jgi:uncharacterized iron-regulated membrane protein
MIDALVVGLAIACGLACPLHMWWSRRRGTKAACCAPDRSREPATEREALHDRQQRLARQVADARSSQRPDAPAR